MLVREYEGVYGAIQYLIHSGHRKIAFIQEKEEYYRLTERTLGYMDCLENNQLSYDENRIVQSDLTVEGGYQATKQLLNQAQFTALFCSNDAMAIGAYRAIREFGKKIPEDISIIGFDGLKLGEYLNPSLTTLVQPIFDIGYVAAKFTLGAIENPSKKIPNRFFNT